VPGGLKLLFEKGLNFTGSKVIAILFAFLLAPVGGSAPEHSFQLMETSIEDVHKAMLAGTLTCHELVEQYLGRIRAYDQQGPALKAMLYVNPRSFAEADAMDQEFERTHKLKPLGCIPIVLKDNFDTADMPTTAGALTLKGAQPERDAFAVKRLREAGALILAKANMSEFATGGISASSLGGQVKNPYDLTRTPGGSSGGTGAAGGGASASAGSGANTVAQNPFDLSAERGLSSFNQTQKFTADYLWELPFGHDKHWLNGNTPMRAVLGDWQWSGDWTFATGLPFTPRLLNEACEVNGGTSGTLRPDVVAGEAVQLSHPSIGEWFNTAAFASPSTCQYGTARRNSIIGPGTKVFDMAFTKVIPLQESRTLEFRAQATNVFNMPNYSSIDTNLNSPTYGRVTAVGSMRQITMTARFRF